MLRLSCAAATLVIGGLAGALMVAPPSVAQTAAGNDEITGATVIGSLPYTTTVEIDGATASPSDPTDCWSGATTWYTLTAPKAGVIRFSSGARYTHDQFGLYSGGLAIYAGSPMEATRVGCDTYDSGVGGVHPEADVSVQAGQRIYVMTGASRAEDVTLTLTAHYVDLASGNDEITGATVIGSLPSTTTQDITGATASPSDPARCWSGVSTWYTVTAPKAGTLRFTGGGRYTHDSYGHYGGALAVYAGSPRALTLVGCDVYDDRREHVGANAEVQVGAGQQLYVLIGETGSSSDVASGVLLTLTAQYVNPPPGVTVKTGMHFKPGTALSTSGATPSFEGQIKWTASDLDGICSQRVVVDRHDSNGTFYSRSTYNPASSVRVLTTNMRVGDSVDATVYATDCAGSVEGVGNRRFQPRLLQENALAYSAGWRTGVCTCWSGGAAMKVAKTGAKATYRFTGSSIGVVMPRAALRGSVDVYLDGVKSRTISLYAASSVNRSVVWETAFATSAAHTLELVSTGTKQVDVDALLVN